MVRFSVAAIRPPSLETNETPLKGHSPEYLSDLPLEWRQVPLHDLKHAMNVDSEVLVGS